MWQNQNELRFIKGIGTGTFSSIPTLPSRAELLKGYLEACEQRNNWEGMDRDVIMGAVREELNRESRVISELEKLKTARPSIDD